MNPPRAENNGPLSLGAPCKCQAVRSFHVKCRARNINGTLTSQLREGSLLHLTVSNTTRRRRKKQAHPRSTTCFPESCKCQVTPELKADCTLTAQDQECGACSRKQAFCSQKRATLSTHEAAALFSGAGPYGRISSGSGNGGPRFEGLSLHTVSGVEVATFELGVGAHASHPSPFTLPLLSFTLPSFDGVYFRNVYIYIYIHIYVR